MYKEEREMYVSPEYKNEKIEANDVITTSEAYRVEQNGVSGGA